MSRFNVRIVVKTVCQCHVTILKAYIINILAHCNAINYVSLELVIKGHVGGHFSFVRHLPMDELAGLRHL